MYSLNQQPLLKATRMFRKHTQAKWNMMTDCKDTRTGIKLESVYKIISYHRIFWFERDPLGSLSPPLKWIPYKHLTCILGARNQLLPQAFKLKKQWNQKSSCRSATSKQLQPRQSQFQPRWSLYLEENLQNFWFGVSLILFFFNLHLNRIKTTGGKNGLQWFQLPETSKHDPDRCGNRTEPLKTPLSALPVYRILNQSRFLIFLNILKVSKPVCPFLMEAMLQKLKKFGAPILGLSLFSLNTDHARSVTFPTTKLGT